MSRSRVNLLDSLCYS